MHVKRIVAPTMPEALKIIKHDLGENAVILSTRKIKGESGAQTLEITAAIDSLTPPPSDAKPEPKGIEGYLEQKKSAPAPQGLEGLLGIHGVSPEVTDKIGSAITSLASTGFDDFDTLDMVLGKMVPFSSPAAAMPKGMAHVFIGPTGCGKTTTLCKLAVKKRIDGHSVGLLTLDNQKVGAFEQLNIYADAMKEQAYILKAPDDFANAQVSMGPKDYLLVDTPGLNPFNHTHMKSLKQKIENLGLDVMVHLVLPAGMHPQEMAHIPAAVAGFHPQSLIFTKLDETAYLGAMTNVAIASGLKVCYVTDGPRVPTDMLELDSGTLAQKLTQPPKKPWEA